MMMKKTTLALSAALVLGSASTALAQFYAPYVGPAPYGYYGYYGAPYAYGAPYGYGPYAYGPNGTDTWWTNRRALAQRRSMGDTNGF
jgi:hypothetical protein